MRQQIIDDLCLLLDGKLPDRLTGSYWEVLIRLARSSSVLSRIANNYSEKFKQQLPDFIIEQFSAINRHSDLLRQQVFFEARELNSQISKCSKQPAIFLKGAAYILSKESVGEGRLFSDIDILVKKDDLEKIERRLNTFGWFHNAVHDYDQKYYRDWAHEIPPLIKAGRGTVVDIHHNLIPPISGKAPNIGLFLEHLVKLDNGYHILSSHALALHSAIHLFYQEEFIHGFRDLSDLHLIFTSQINNPDFYDQLLLLAEKANFCLELFYTCRYLQLVFRTSIDAKFLGNVQQYKPNTLKLVVMDWIFLRVLLPRHTLVNKPFTNVAHQMAFLRGHWLKMPFHILCIHTYNKLAFAISHFLTGKTKVQNAPQAK